MASNESFHLNMRMLNREVLNFSNLFEPSTLLEAPTRKVETALDMPGHHAVRRGFQNPLELIGLFAIRLKADHLLMEQCLDTTWMGMSPEAGTCLTEEISPSCCATTVFIKVVDKIRLHQAVYEVMLVSLPIKSRVFKSNVGKPAINIRGFRIVWNHQNTRGH